MLIHKAIVIGGSGLVGSALLNELVGDSDFLEVHALLRRPLPDSPPRIREHIVDFSNIGSWDVWQILDEHPDHHAVLFCCLGTTLKQAGTEEEYRRIDHDLPLAIAKVARDHGVRHFIAVSGVLRKDPSKDHYSRSKAALERDLIDVGFHSLTIIKPSLLLGDRREKRWLEILLKFIMTPLGFIIPAQWRGVHDWQAAQAMITSAMSEPVGVRIISNAEMVKLRR